MPSCRSRIGSAVSLLLTCACTGGQVGATDRQPPSGDGANGGDRGDAPQDPQGNGGATNEPTARALDELLDLRPPDGGSAIRKLTNEELAALYEDLVGFVPKALLAMPLDRTDHNFAAVVQSQALIDQHVDGYLAIADEVADALVPVRLHQWSSACKDADTLDDEAQRLCMQDFTTRFAARAFRRPPSPEARVAAMELYEQAEDFSEGLRQVIRYVLLGSHTNYLIEVPDDDNRVDDHALASRLSFGLCRRPPDEALRSEAANGRLSRPEVLARHARRLWQSPCGRAGVTGFFVDWLGAKRVLSAVRARDIFPDYDSALAQAMLDETRLFIQDLVFADEAPLASLLLADHGRVNQALGSLYGIEVRGDEYQQVVLPAERRGVLTHASILTATAGEHGTSPVKRGLFVLQRLLCADLPPPPANVPLPQARPGEEPSPRALWERHVSDPACAGCHRFIDPVGFAFEAFDEIGRFRSEDRNGYAVDARAGLPLLDIPMGELEGVAELAQALTGTPHLPACLARNWLRHTLGRLEGPRDKASLLATARALHAGESLANALLGLFDGEAFLRPMAASVK